MLRNSIKLLIPFEALVESLREMKINEKYRILELLEEQIAQFEEELLEKNPTVCAQIQEARDAYHTGDYLTVDEYVARRKGNKV